jgi:cytosine/uracil/thiamine/allantoin permease
VAQKQAQAPTPEPQTRAERVLGFMVVAIIGLSILAIAGVLIGYATKANDGTGIWQVIDLLPGIGLPIGFVLLIVLLVLTFARRSRAAKGAGK